MRVRGTVGVVAALLSVGVGFAAWLFFAPTQLGGSTSYALIVGRSMEPRLERGDLALVRSGRSYRVGDVVLYDNARLGARVLHRIIAVEGDRYVLKGDSNDFVDGDRPTLDRVHGKLWVGVPFAGRIFGWTRVPLHAALLVGIAAFLAVGGGAGSAAVVRRGRRRRAEAPTPSVRPRRAGGRTHALEPVALGVAVVLAVFVAFSLLAFGRPLTREVKVPGAWVERGSFSYSAPAKQGVVYPSGRASSGEPVFLKLADRLQVSFAYRLDSKQPVAVTGTASLRATLGDGGGWARTFVLQAPTRFSGAGTTLQGTLDLRRLQTLAGRFREDTGAAIDSFTVVVSPRVAIAGTIDGRPVGSSFAPEPLAFRLDGVRLALDTAGEPLVLTRSQEREGTKVEPASLSLAGLRFGVATGRTLALGGAAAALAALLVLGLVALRRRGGDEPFRIESRYGDLLVPVARSHGQHTGRLAELRDIESLVAIAQRYDRLILHERHDGVHYYLVEDDGVVYRYSAREQGAEQELRVAPHSEAATSGRDVVVVYSEQPAKDALVPGGHGRRYGTHRFRWGAGKGEA